MATKTKKNITIHPVNNGVVDTDTDLFPKTVVGNIYQDGGETVYPFDTIVQEGDNISVLTDNVGYAKTSELSEVATSGDYDDLSNKLSITVESTTLVIKQQ